MFALGRSVHSVLFGLAFSGLAAGSPLSAVAQNAERAGNWASGSGQGYTEYRTTSGRSYISINCDIAATEDHSRTGISIEIDGKRLSPKFDLELDIDGQKIKWKTNAVGNLSTRNCKECAEAFYQIWPLLREGRRLQVTIADGRRATFSLRGTSRLLPAQPCEAAFPLRESDDTTRAMERGGNVGSAAVDLPPPAPQPLAETPARRSLPTQEVAAPGNRVPARDGRCSRDTALLVSAGEASRDRNRVVFTSKSESIVIGREPTAWIFDAGDGDDTIYAMDPPDVADINGGLGSDVILVCKMRGLSLKISLSGDTVGSDLAPDELIIEPEVFLGLPDEVERQIMVFGFTQGSDLIRLRLPPGVEFSFGAERDSTTARAGKVAFSIHRADSRYGVDESAFVVEHVDALPVVEEAEFDVPLASYDPALSCSDGDALEASKPTERTAGIAFYGAAGALRIETIPEGVTHQSGEDDDQLFAYTSQTVDAGGGADLILVCSLDEPFAPIAVGRARDFDADTVVVETGRLQDGVERELHVSNLTLRNDRVILRVPEGLDVSYINNREGVPSVARIGDLSVMLGVGDWDQKTRSEIDMFIVERTSGPVSLGSGLAPPKDVSAITCPDPKSRKRIDRGFADPTFSTAVRYTNGDDVALLDNETESVSTGAGDDLVYVVTSGNDLTVDTGRGSDTVMLCEMGGIYLNVVLGGDALMSDVSPDTVVLAPEMFAGVPEGLRRQINIFGFMPENDQLVLRLPVGTTVHTIRDTKVGAVEVRAGNVVVKLSRADDWQKKPFNFDAVVVEQTDVVITAKRPVPPTVNPAHLTATCPDPESALEYATPPEPTKRFPDQRFYGAEDDTILVKGEPGILGYSSGGGDDTIYVFDPVANGSVGVGKGSNLLLICAMSEIRFFTGMAAPDLQPDTIIIELGALADVPEGLKREIWISNVVPINDRVVLRLPPGENVIIDGLVQGQNTLRATVGDTQIIVGTQNGPDEPADIPVIILQQGGSKTGTRVPAAANPAGDTAASNEDEVVSSADGKSLIGEWAGSGEGRVTAIVRADPKRPGYFVAEIGTETPACMGGVNVTGQLGEVAVATAEPPYEGGEICRIELRLIGVDRLRVSEVDNCLSFHGMACGFTAELTRHGIEAPAAPRTAGRPPPPAGGRGGQVPWAPECEFLRLDPAFAPVEVAATASPEGIDCYAIKPIAGTDVTIEIAEGRNVVLSISSLVDAVDRHRFRASGSGYRVTVGQLMRSATQEPYRITFSSGAIQPLPKAGSASKRWRVYGNAGEGRLGAQGLAKDGVTTVSIGCNRLLGKALGGSLDGYTGDGLTRVDDETDTLVFEFLDARGRRVSFESEVNYFAPDKAWAFRDFPLRMMAPFARGSKLTLRNGRGQLIAEFGLKGSARAVAAMRTECGF